MKAVELDWDGLARGLRFICVLLWVLLCGGATAQAQYTQVWHDQNFNGLLEGSPIACPGCATGTTRYSPVASTTGGIPIAFDVVPFSGTPRCGSHLFVPTSGVFLQSTSCSTVGAREGNELRFTVPGSLLWIRNLWFTWSTLPLGWRVTAEGIDEVRVGMGSFLTVTGLPDGRVQIDHVTPGAPNTTAARGVALRLGHWRRSFSVTFERLPSFTAQSVFTSVGTGGLPTDTAWQLARTQPGVWIEAPPVSDGTPLSVTVRFSEPVMGLEPDDLVLSGLTLVPDSLAGSGDRWTFEALPGEGRLGIQIRGGAAVGVATGAYSVVSSEWVGYRDTTPPTSRFVSPPPTRISTTQALSFNVTTDEPLAVTWQCSLNEGPWQTCNPAANWPTLPDGAYTMALRATDAFGNVEAPPLLHPFTVDRTLPVAEFVSVPPARSALASHLVTFRCNEEPCTFQCQLGTGSYVSCSSPWTVTTANSTTWSIRVRAIDSFNNGPSAAAFYSFVVDRTGPFLGWTQRPAATSNVTTPTLAFSIGDAVSVACSLNGAAPSICVSPIVLGPLTDGAYTFRLEANDDLGNISALTHTWTVDTVPPETTLITAEPAFTNDPTGDFEFGANEAGVTYRCRVNAGAETTCASVWSTASLTDGNHTLTVYAVDAAGNADLTPVTATWTLDRVVPDTRLVLTEPNPTTDTTGDFTFNCNGELACTFQCSVDDAEWSPCVSAYATEPLALGFHTFRVRSIDRAGNIDPTPASHTWELITLAGPEPNTIVDRGPNNPTTESSATFIFRSTVDGSTFTCSLDGAPWQTCSSPVALSNLPNGVRSFRMRAQSPLGRYDATPTDYVWTINAGFPDTTIVSGPAFYTNDRTADFIFSSTRDGTFECALDGGAWVACPVRYATATLAAGVHQLQVRARDLSGNLDPTPAAASWTLDFTPPVSQFTVVPAAGISGTTVSFEFTANETPVTFECRLDAGAWTPCVSPLTLTDVPQGARTLEIRATDRSQNTEITPRLTRWTVDSIRPETTLFRTPDPYTAIPESIFTFASSEPTSVLQCRLNEGVWTPCTSPRTINLTEDGTWTFEVRAIDGAGLIDETPARWTWVLDRVPPDTAVLEGPPPWTSDSNAEFLFGSNEDEVTYYCESDVELYGPCEEFFPVNFFPEGERTLWVQAIDRAGNIDPTPAVWVWNVDFTDPDTFLTGPDGIVPAGLVDFELSASEPDVTWRCTLDDSPLFECAPPLQLDVQGGGPHVVTARATDRAGNTDPTPAEWRLVADADAPDTFLTETPDSPTRASVHRFAFTASEDGAVFRCTLDAGASFDCTSPWSFTGLEDGTYTFTVAAGDALGQFDPTPATHTWTIDTRIFDTDGDGLNDLDEITFGTNPLLVDTDSDGLCDGALAIAGSCEAGEDFDADGVVDDDETDPRTEDTDGDGLLDGTELLGLNPTDPRNVDTDGDGFCDGPIDVLPTCSAGEDLDADGAWGVGESNPNDPLSVPDDGTGDDAGDAGDAGDDAGDDADASDDAGDDATEDVSDGGNPDADDASDDATDGDESDADATDDASDTVPGADAADGEDGATDASDTTDPGADTADDAVADAESDAGADTVEDTDTAGDVAADTADDTTDGGGFEFDLGLEDVRDAGTPGDTSLDVPGDVADASTDTTDTGTPDAVADAATDAPTSDADSGDAPSDVSDVATDAIAEDADAAIRNDIREDNDAPDGTPESDAAADGATDEVDTGAQGDAMVPADDVRITDVVPDGQGTADAASDPTEPDELGGRTESGCTTSGQSRDIAWPLVAIGLLGLTRHRRRSPHARAA